MGIEVSWSWRIKFSELLDDLKKRGEDALKSALSEIDKALTPDPLFLERRILGLLAQVYPHNKGLSFNELQEETRTTTSRLSRVLRTLQKRGCITRHAYKLFPRRVEYRLKEEYLEKATTYWIEDKSNIALLKTAIYLQEFLQFQISYSKKYDFIEEAKRYFHILVDEVEMSGLASLLAALEEPGPLEERVEAAQISELFLAPENIAHFYEEKALKLIERTFSFLAGDLQYFGLMIVRRKINGIREIALRARHMTPMLLYGFYIIQVCISILETIGKTPKEIMPLFLESSIFKKTPTFIQSILENRY
ncbi:MAG: winged helix-turn-helix transcriptional regulator [Candidatus Bathyarchaeia archaeon]